MIIRQHTEHGQATLESILLIVTLTLALTFAFKKLGSALAGLHAYQTFWDTWPFP